MRIEVKGHVFYFGMTAVAMWQKKCGEEVLRFSEGRELKPEEIVGRMDPMRAFTFLVYAGLCNEQDRKEDGGSKPTFSEAYDIAESLNEKEQNIIWKAFEESRAGKDLIDKLPKAEKKSTSKTKETRSVK